MHLDLVDGGHDVGALQQRVEVVGHEVADADRAHLAVGEQRLQRPVGVERPVEGRRERLVQEQQVDLVDAELGGALVERVQRGVVAVVADPDLRLDEDLVAVDAGAADPFADLALVDVRRPRCRCGDSRWRAPSRPRAWSPRAASGRRRGRWRESGRRCSGSGAVHASCPRAVSSEAPRSDAAGASRGSARQCATHLTAARRAANSVAADTLSPGPRETARCPFMLPRIWPTVATRGGDT